MPESIRIQEHDKTLTIQVRDPVEALRMLAEAKMRPFTQQDWYAFAGCESEDPMIGEVGDFTVVLDGEMFCILHFEDGYGGTIFKLSGNLT